MKKFILSLILAIILIASPASAEFFRDVIVTSPNAIWTDSRAYTTLNDAISAVGTNERTIKVVSPQTVTNLTIPTNVTLDFERNGAISNSGQLTINTRNIRAPDRQIFTGAGDIDFAPGSIIKSAWFSDFETAVTKIGADNVRLIVSSAASIADDCTTNANTTLEIPSAGRILTIANLKTFTINGPFDAGHYQVFSGGGSVVFGDVGARIIYPQWSNIALSNISIVSSMPSTTTGVGNTSVGYEALQSNTTGTLNTAIGYRSLMSNTTGASNTSAGYLSLFYNTTGYLNIAFGEATLARNSTGYQNTAIGGHALENNTGGRSNTAVGYRSLCFNDTGQYNVAIGENTLVENIDGECNTAVGVNALHSNTTADFNVSIGEASMLFNTTGANNAAVGCVALMNNTTGANNVAIGYKALLSNITGINNTAAGTYALSANTTAYGNVAVGFNSLVGNTTGVDNSSVGYNTMVANTSGHYNSAFGHQALTSNTTGSNNIAIGISALGNNTTGTKNVAVGDRALLDNNASSITAIGSNALLANTTGGSNTSIGADTLSANIVGNDNTALGSNALLVSNANSNTAIGSSGLTANTTGESNVAIGVNALGNNTTGNYNTAIGTTAGHSLVGGVDPNQTTSESVYIGNSTKASADGVINENVFGNSAEGIGSNTVSIGNGAITRTLLRGNVGVGTLADNPLAVNRAADGVIVDFSSGYVVQGTISIAGAATSYNAFIGSHYVQLKKGQVEPALGTVVVSTGEIIPCKIPEKEYFPYVTTTDKIGDKRIYGTWFGKMSDDAKGSSFGQNGKPIYLVAQVGLFKIRVTDTNGDIEIGDFLETSMRSGEARRQNSEFRKSSTIAKAMVNVDWDDEEINPISGYKVKLIPCTF